MSFLLGAINVIYKLEKEQKIFKRYNFFSRVYVFNDVSFINFYIKYGKSIDKEMYLKSKKKMNIFPFPKSSSLYI